MSNFDLSKIMSNGGHCVTRDGRKARIVCTDAKGNWPIIALVLDSFGNELPLSAEINGRCSPRSSDLQNPPEPKRRVKVDFCVTAGEGYRSLGDERDRRPNAGCIHLTGSIEEGSELTIDLDKITQGRTE